MLQDQVSPTNEEGGGFLSPPKVLDKYFARSPSQLSLATMILDKTPSPMVPKQQTMSKLLTIPAKAIKPKIMMNEPPKLLNYRFFLGVASEWKDWTCLGFYKSGFYGIHPDGGNRVRLGIFWFCLNDFPAGSAQFALMVWVDRDFVEKNIEQIYMHCFSRSIIPKSMTSLPGTGGTLKRSDSADSIVDLR